MALPDLICCIGQNKRFAQIAIEEGFLYGARLPNTVYFPIYFADQDWKKPNRTRYIQALEKYKPRIATVLDWEREEQLSEVLDWAEEATQHVEIVIIIPKVIGGIEKIPETINGKTIRLGYSVPTKYGGTTLSTEEFGSREVHLLGGSPGKQMRLHNQLNIKSVDGNMHMKMSQWLGCYWTKGKKPFRNRWEKIKKNEDGTSIRDGMYDAFRTSCKNIISAWKEIYEF